MASALPSRLASSRRRATARTATGRLRRPNRLGAAQWATPCGALTLAGLLDEGEVAQEVALAEVDAVVSQDGVGGRGVEVEVRELEFVDVA